MSIVSTVSASVRAITARKRTDLTDPENPVQVDCYDVLFSNGARVVSDTPLHINQVCTLTITTEEPL